MVDLFKKPLDWLFQHYLTVFLKALLPSGFITGLIGVIKLFLSQPTTLGWLGSLWIALALLATVVVVRLRRLTVLEERLEYVNQHPNGTHYITPGREMALVIPLKNDPKFWLPTLRESDELTAHIDYFAENGQQLEAVYGAMWINERTARVSFRVAETKLLIVAVTDRGSSISGRWWAPEQLGGAGDFKNIREAYEQGAMLSLKPLDGSLPTIRARVHLRGSYSTDLLYRIHFRPHPELERIGLSWWE